ncbi:MAG: DUF4139 domain-containing protein [Bacteroidia bacterium]
MKKLFLYIVITTISLRSFSQSEKLIKQTTIKEVKIYLNGAIVTRTAQTNVDAGITKLVIDNLSPYINAQSINVTGTGDVTIVAVLHQLNYLNNSEPTPEAKKLQDTLDDLKDRMQFLQNTKYILDQEEQLLLANKQSGGKDGTNAATLNSLADVFIQRLTKVKEQQTLQNKKIKTAQEEINRITNQLAQLNQKNENGTGSIIITVSAKAHTAATLEVSYLVANASWTPLYDIRANDINSPLTLAYKANVTQNTGEEWKDVKLKLSTGNPTLSGDKPLLYPWNLDFVQPVAWKGNGGGNGYANTSGTYTVNVTDANGSLATGSDVQLLADTIQPMAYTWSSLTADANQNQLATDFTIALPYSIPSDGKEYLVEVQNYTLNATYNYSAVPKKDKDVFLAAYIKDWEDLNLVAGNASIYFQNSYVGNTYINTRNTEDSLLFSLGRDKRIVVTREKQKDFSSKQFMGNNITRTYSFEFSIKNTKKDTVVLTVEDQIPLSQNSSIEVKLLESNGAIYNAENGNLKWIINVAPGETQKRKFSFSVKYPKGKTVDGL